VEEILQPWVLLYKYYPKKWLPKENSVIE
jgi:hypothetical protein